MIDSWIVIPWAMRVSSIGVIALHPHQPGPTRVGHSGVDGIIIGGVITGGTTTGGGVTSTPDITETLHEFVPAELVTTRVYGVVTLIGGVIRNDHELPRTRFPGFSVHVSEFIIDQVSNVPLPLMIFVGLAVSVQVGGVILLSVERRVK